MANKKNKKLQSGSCSLPKAILFDLDDTISSYRQASEKPWHEVCYQYRKSFNGQKPEAVQRQILKVRKWFWSDPDRHRTGRTQMDKTMRHIVTIAFEEINLDQKLAEEIADVYSEKRQQAITLFPNSIATLEKLKTTDIKLALVTNGAKKYQQEKIKRFHLAKFFDLILIEGVLGYGKPQKEIYLQAIDQLKLPPEEMWFVGDNLLWDVQMPQKFNMVGIWNNYDYLPEPYLKEVQPDYIINEIAELLPVFNL